MDASVIIVNWNTKELLRKCLLSIERQQACSIEIFVVDNNSMDGSVEMLRNEFPRVQAICNTKNRGFAAANNQALRLAKGSIKILLNSDIELLSTNTIASLLAFHKETGAGIVGPRLLNPDMTLQQSVRRFPTVWSQLFIVLKLHLIFPNANVMKKYLEKDFDYKTSHQVDQVSGAFFSISTQCAEKVGELDERFWIWFEEVDYCKRASQMGFPSWYFAGVEALHYGGQSFQKVIPSDRQRKFNASLLQYANKYFSTWERLLLRLFFPISRLLAVFTPSSARLSSYNKKR